MSICTTDHWNMLNRVEWQGHSCWLWRFQWRDRIWATKKRVHAPPPIHAGHPIPSTQLGVCLSDNMPCFVFRILYPVFCIQLKLILDVYLCDDNQCFVLKCVLLHSTDVLWFIQLNLRYSNKIYNLNIVNCFDTAELWLCHMVSGFFSWASEDVTALVHTQKC